MTPSDLAAPGAARTGHILLKSIVAGLVLLKLAAMLWVNPVADEAYYWLWGQHPQLSYYDHPPLNAWLLGFVDLLFGRSLYSLRLLTALTFVGTVWLFRDWAKRFAGEAWEAVFWRSLAIYLASPTFGVYTSLATSDHLLLFLALLAGHFFVLYFVAVKETGRGRLRHLYGGAVLLGLAGLAKYNAVFVGVGLVAYILVSPGLRPLLRNPHLWLAGLVAVAMQAPILIWNLQYDFASFRFHLIDRHDAGYLSQIDLRGLREFAEVTALVASPFLLWGIGKFLLRPPAGTWGRTAWGLAHFVFWASTLTFVAVALTDRIFWWWNLLAYIMILPFMGAYMKGRFLFFAHIGFGTLISVLQVVSSTILPVLFLFDLPDPTRSRNYGWELLEQPIAALTTQYRPDFIAAAKWEQASILGFVTGNPDVVSINPRPSAFHYWFDREAHRGDDALVVTYNNNELDVARAQFDRLTLVEEIPIERLGYEFGTYRVFWAEGYKPGY